MIRTFIAIDLPSDVLHALATMQTEVRDALRGQGLDRAMRWSPVQNLHLTLRFLGDTTDAQRTEITARLQTIAGKTAPFALAVDGRGRGLGGFPNLRQPRVLWSGVGGDLAALQQLQSEVEALAQAAGFAPEPKRFSPHLTLARAAREADRRILTQVGRAIDDFMQQAPEAAPMSFTVGQVVFYQSELSSGGSRYTPLFAAPLADA